MDQSITLARNIKDTEPLYKQPLLDYSPLTTFLKRLLKGKHKKDRQGWTKDSESL